MEVNHVQGGRKMRLSQPQQLMAQDRKIVDEAYAGDIIGVFDPGIFLLEIRSVFPTRNLNMKEFLLLPQNILPECGRWIP